jgi:hypothetical protein
LTALSVKVRVPLTLPIADGVNLTPTVQAAPAASPTRQLLPAIVKPALAAMLEKLRATVWRFVTVTVFAAVVSPTATVPKLRAVDENETAAVPVPVRAAVWVPALSLIVSVPETDPRTVGVKETCMVQEEPGAMLALQLLVWLKGAAVVTLETCMGPLPVFCNVTVLAVLVVARVWKKERLAGVTEAAGAVPVPELKRASARVVFQLIVAAPDTTIFPSGCRAMEIPSESPPKIAVTVPPVPKLASNVPLLL